MARTSRTPPRSLRRSLAEGLAVAAALAAVVALVRSRDDADAAPPAVAPAVSQVDRDDRDDRPFAQRRPAPAAPAESQGADSGGAAASPELDALLAEFAAHGGGLACRVDRAPPTNDAVVVLDDGRALPVLALLESTLFVGDPNGALADGPSGGTLEVAGHDRVEITWSPGRDGVLRCDDEPVVLSPLSSGVVGYVVGADGLPEGRVWVTGCGGTAFTDEDGAFFLPAHPGPCTVQGVRQDGYWQSRTDRLEVQVEAGSDVDVDLVLPERPRGGVGVGIRATPDGVVMWQVHQGGAAHEAGIPEGSLVLAIEGEPYEPWDLQAFIDTVTGPAGTDVELTIETPDGQVETVLLDRREMGPTG